MAKSDDEKDLCWGITDTEERRRSNIGRALEHAGVGDKWGVANLGIEGSCKFGVQIIALIERVKALESHVGALEQFLSTCEIRSVKRRKP